MNIKDASKISTLLTVVFLLSLPVSLSGQNRPGRGEEVDIEGLIVIEEGTMFLMDVSGAIYGIGSASDLRGNRPDGNQMPRDKEPPQGVKMPGSLPENLEVYDGAYAFVSGMKFQLPPGMSPFGDMDAVIMPFSILIDGEEILISEN